MDASKNSALKGDMNMNQTHSIKATKNNAEAAELKKILGRCADETISEEQVERVLRPILLRIEAGEFKPRRKNSVKRAVFSTVAAAAVLIMGIAIELTRSVPAANISTGFVIIPESRPPLASSILHRQTLYGKVTVEDKGIEGAMLELHLVGDEQIKKTTQTNQLGMFSFDEPEDGTYTLRVKAPEMGHTEMFYAGTWIVAGGRVGLVSEGAYKVLYDGMEILLCLTNTIEQSR